ncbi:hypothetical protein ACS0TY_029795 [Phlomoides rotata]
MKLQRPDRRAFTYIKEKESKPELVIDLIEDDICTRRAWGIWVCLTEMDKVKYSFKIYQNSTNGSFLLNMMTSKGTRLQIQRSSKRGQQSGKIRSSRQKTHEERRAT